MATLMRDSRISDDWILNGIRNCPIVELTDQNGQKTGNIRTCPVRLAFVSVFTAKAAKGATNAKYQATLLFPPNVDFTLLLQAYYAGVQKFFPQQYQMMDRTTGVVPGLHSPFHNQAEKAGQYSGYTPGCWFLNTSSLFQPAIVDPNGNPIVDPKRVYSGVWAVPVLNLYHYGVSPPQPKKGVSFGLQGMMVVADDQNLGGVGIDPQKAFQGMQITPDFSAAAAFGTNLPGQPGQPTGFPMPAGGTPGMGPGNAYPVQPVPGTFGNRPLTAADLM